MHFINSCWYLFSHSFHILKRSDIDGKSTEFWMKIFLFFATIILLFFMTVKLLLSAFIHSKELLQYNILSYNVKNYSNVHMFFNS